MWTVAGFTQRSHVAHHVISVRFCLSFTYPDPHGLRRNLSKSDNPRRGYTYDRAANHYSSRLPTKFC
jgi:hypothetical protein